MISVMSRLDYNKTCVLLCNCFDDIAQQYQQVNKIIFIFFVEFMAEMVYTICMFYRKELFEESVKDF